MTRPLRAAGSILAARRATLLPGAPSPFVTQSQLIDLVKTDRSDIQRHVHRTEWMMRHPHRGTSAAPYLLMADWGRLLRWLDAAIQHPEGPVNLTDTPPSGHMSPANGHPLTPESGGNTEPAVMHAASRGS